MGAIVSYLLFRLIVGEMLVNKAEARACTDTQVVQTSLPSNLQRHKSANSTLPVGSPCRTNRYDDKDDK